VLENPRDDTFISGYSIPHVLYSSSGHLFERHPPAIYGQLNLGLDESTVSISSAGCFTTLYKGTCFHFCCCFKAPLLSKFLYWLMSDAVTPFPMCFTPLAAISSSATRLLFTANQISAWMSQLYPFLLLAVLQPCIKGRVFTFAAVLMFSCY